MRIGIVRTLGSPCRCGESIALGAAALGHEPVLVDSEEIEARAPELARACEVVFEHADTYARSGRRRWEVRAALERAGARVAGSDAARCALADDKVETKAALALAGIPVPETRGERLVVKAVHEHMSRGVSVLTPAEALARLGAAPERLLVERYIEGRELGVSVLARADGTLDVLPPAEWRLAPGEILTGEMKLAGAPIVRAELAPDLLERIERLARRAFDALELDDYARFDVRVAADGTPYFLEANVRPSLEPTEAFPLSAAWAGIEYPALVGRLIESALARVRIVTLDGVHRLARSSVTLARLLDARPGERVLDLGCGSGILAIAAARRGARVLATDVSARALENALENAALNGVSIETRRGSWYAALEEGERFDLIVAAPPQTPAARDVGPRWGGEEGTRHLAAVIEGAVAALVPGGRLWLLAISLANPARVARLLARHFADVRLVAETDREFEPEEFDDFDYLVRLRAEGRCEFERGRFKNRFWRASGWRGGDS